MRALLTISIIFTSLLSFAKTEPLKISDSTKVNISTLSATCEALNSSRNADESICYNEGLERLNIPYLSFINKVCYVNYIVHFSCVSEALKLIINDYPGSTPSDSTFKLNFNGIESCVARYNDDHTRASRCYTLGTETTGDNYAKFVNRICSNAQTHIQHYECMNRASKGLVRK